MKIRGSIYQRILRTVVTSESLLNPNRESVIRLRRYPWLSSREVKDIYICPWMVPIAIFYKKWGRETLSTTTRVQNKRLVNSSRRQHRVLRSGYTSCNFLERGGVRKRWVSPLIPPSIVGRLGVDYLPGPKVQDTTL